MCIVLHCRVLLVYLPVYLSVYPLYISFLTCTLNAMLVWLTVEPMWRTDNKVYQLILSKADLLSCLSTTLGLEHEPLLPNRVVNLQHVHYKKRKERTILHLHSNKHFLALYPLLLFFPLMKHQLAVPCLAAS